MALRTLLALLAAFAVARAENVPDSVIDDYLAAAEPEEKDPNDWKFKIGLGATFTDGNSQSLTFAFSFEGIKQLREDLKLTLTEASTFSQSNGTESGNEHIFVERIDWDIDELSKLFQTLLIEHDNVEKLRIRFVFAIGYTRQLVDKEDFDLWVDVGPGVIYEDYRTPTGENNEAILVITVRWIWKLSKDLTYEQTISVWPSLNHGGEGRVVAEAKFTTPVGDNWNLQLIIRDVYNSEPPPGNVKNDFTVILALTMTF